MNIGSIWASLGTDGAAVSNGGVVDDPMLGLPDGVMDGIIEGTFDGSSEVGTIVGLTEDDG